MLTNSVHFVDHPPDNSALNCHNFVFYLGLPFRAADVFYKKLIDLCPMTLVREMSGAFDDSDQGVLTGLCALDDCFEFVVWILIASNYYARTSKNLS